MPADPPPRTRVHFTRAAWVWVAVAVVVAVVGWYKTINLLVLAGYFLLALLAVNLALAWRASARLRAERLPAPPAFAGETVTVTAEVFSEATQPLTTLVTAAAEGNRSAWLFAPLAPGDRQTITARWAFARRGRHRLGPLAVDSSYPLGLVHVTRELSGGDTALVLPAIGPVDLELFRHWLIRQRAGEGETHRPSRRASLGDGDVRGLRPYRLGDSPREIHWKTSARRNQLMVREYDCSEPIDVVLILDPWLPEAGDVSEILDPRGWEAKVAENREAARRLEWALSLAVSLGMALALGDHPAELTLIVPGRPPGVYHGRATTAFIRRAFADLAEIAGAADVPLTPAEVVRPRSNRAARVVISSRAGSPQAATLRAAGVSCADVHPGRPPNWFGAPPALAPGNRPTPPR